MTSTKATARPATPRHSNEPQTLTPESAASINDAELAFSTQRLLPAWESIPDEFKRGNIPADVQGEHQGVQSAEELPATRKVTLRIVTRPDERRPKTSGVANLTVKSQDQTLFPKIRLCSLG